MVFIVTVWLGATLTFFLPRISGEDPFEYEFEKLIENSTTENPQATNFIREFSAHHAIGEPLWNQYVTYLVNAVTLDFGPSIYGGQTIQEKLTDRIQWTIARLVLSFMIAILMGFLLKGIKRKNLRPFRSSISSVALASLAITAIFLVYEALRVVLYVAFGYGPHFGVADPGIEDYSWTNPAFIWSFVEYSIIPAFSVGSVIAVGWTYGMWRTETAPKPEWRSMHKNARGWGYAVNGAKTVLRDLSVRQSNHFIFAFGLLILGLLMLETPTNYPGVGFALRDAFSDKDYWLIQYLLFAMAYMIATCMLVLGIVRAVMLRWDDNEGDAGTVDRIEVSGGNQAASSVSNDLFKRQLVLLWDWLRQHRIIASVLVISVVLATLFDSESLFPTSRDLLFLRKFELSGPIHEMLLGSILIGGGAAALGVFIANALTLATVKAPKAFEGAVLTVTSSMLAMPAVLMAMLAVLPAAHASYVSNAQLVVLIAMFVWIEPFRAIRARALELRDSGRITLTWKTLTDLTTNSRKDISAGLGIFVMARFVETLLVATCIEIMFTTLRINAAWFIVTPNADTLGRGIASNFSGGPMYSGDAHMVVAPVIITSLLLWGLASLSTRLDALASAWLRQ